MRLLSFFLLTFFLQVPAALLVLNQKLVNKSRYFKIHFSQCCVKCPIFIQWHTRGGGSAVSTACAAMSHGRSPFHSPLEPFQAMRKSHCGLDGLTLLFIVSCWTQWLMNLINLFILGWGFYLRHLQKPFIIAFKGTFLNGTFHKI